LLFPLVQHANSLFPGYKTISHALTWVGTVHADEKDFGSVWFRYFARLLEDGRLKPHPSQVIEGGLGGVSEGLKNLKDGKASGVKYVFDVAKTEGVGTDVMEGLQGASSALQGSITAGFRVS
jgi:NADPH2:quinone reductase